VRGRTGALGVEVAFLGRVDRAATGLAVELGGTSRAVVERLLADLDGAADSLVAPLETARIYAHGGTGARDPRSGALVPRYRDVIRGGLDALLEAWRQTLRPAPPSVQVEE
jgi:hypothetical protein